MASKATKRFSPEVRARAVRLVFEHEKDHFSRWATVTSIAAKIGCTAQSLNGWIKKAEIDNGVRDGVPTEIAERLKALERENRELRQANEILRKASAYFAQAELDRRFKPSSPSSTIIVRPTGSSRAAGFCRSSRRPIMPMSPGALIPPVCPTGSAATQI